MDSILAKCEEDDTDPDHPHKWREEFMRIWLWSKRAEVWASHIASFDWERYKKLKRLYDAESDVEIIESDKEDNTKNEKEKPKTNKKAEEETKKMEMEEATDNDKVILRGEEAMEIHMSMLTSVMDLLEQQPSAVAYFNQILHLRILHHSMLNEEPEVEISCVTRATRFLHFKNSLHYSWKVNRIFAFSLLSNISTTLPPPRTAALTICREAYSMQRD